MSKPPAKHPALSSPLYADKPQRRIPGTDVIAVTVYASGVGHGHVRNYSLFHPVHGHIGHVSAHSKRLAQSAGYHRGHGVYDHRIESWSNLTEAAKALVAEKEAQS